MHKIIFFQEKIIKKYIGVPTRSVKLAAVLLQRKTVKLAAILLQQKTVK